MAMRQLVRTVVVSSKSALNGNLMWRRMELLVSTGCSLGLTLQCTWLSRTHQVGRMLCWNLLGWIPWSQVGTLPLDPLCLVKCYDHFATEYQRSTFSSSVWFERLRFICFVSMFFPMPLSFIYFVMIVLPQEKGWGQPCVEGKGDQQSKKIAESGRIYSMLLLVVYPCFSHAWIDTPQA